MGMAGKEAPKGTAELLDHLRQDREKSTLKS